MGQSFPDLAKKRLGGVVRVHDFAAFLLYAAFSIFLYLPALNVNNLRVICGINTTAAAWGAYFVSKRWVNNWTPSLIAGAAYGLGPFALSFDVFHPLAGLSFASVPWLLLPAIYWHKGKAPDATRFCIRALLSLLPFGAVVLLFWIPAQQWAGPFFLMPKDMALTVKDFTDLIFPLHRSGTIVNFGLYHSCLVFALMGIFVYIKLKRIAVLIPIAAGLVLSFWEPVFQVTPIVWAALPILFLSILSGLGFQALLSAGKADTKWIVFCAITASVLAGFFAGLGIRIIIIRKMFVLSAMMYGLTAVALWMLLFMVRTNLRWSWFKWGILAAAIAIDILLSACYLVNKSF